ncbi:response regulator transcription factor [Aetokthonos hydrillicola Thurmond2011]|jgi:DNA-binding NarL/FixJ family response regulator|uniref:Response regulator transcription factor n=1 Tax=Aetokthonos hydrillicola Thurmond2011 TaxID=2712845 RepID=A0AAP5M5B3_9CYAN|nr:response regulator transcription factor [Aetokthonos hydrillicola]MBO3461813.1 response regulator transcription factor [Aetokthonos hydrillicola CCALA 1050]MBW4589958.1 response regulator transcription factor [Aetokthonos hydrillicola CCALA 1050]MDR9895716.1 response regulator transcription factor [Aetokthonos hydrillicola Thurmond2011]
MIRILLVDDQFIIRQGLKSLLESNSDMKVVGEAENGQRALEQIPTLQPDIVLMDIRMPVMDGVAATGAIAQQYPQTKVLVLTTFDDDEYVSQAMHLGAKGYLLKDTEPDELALAIRAVYKGHTQLGPGLLEKALMSPPTPAEPVKQPPPELALLTPREMDVLRLIASGANNREIAQTLFLSENTVKNYVTNILSHLNLRDRTQAALLAHSLFKEHSA